MFLPLVHRVLGNRQLGLGDTFEIQLSEKRKHLTSCLLYNAFYNFILLRKINNFIKKTAGFYI